MCRGPRRGGAPPTDPEETLKPDDLVGQERIAPLEMSPAEFRRVGHALVDRIASFLDGIRTDPPTPGETPAPLRPFLGGPPPPSLPGPPAASLRRRLGRAAGGRGRRPAPRPLAPQRSSTLHGIHHLVGGAARRAGGPARPRG